MYTWIRHEVYLRLFKNCQNWFRLVLYVNFTYYNDVWKFSHLESFWIITSKINRFNKSTTSGQLSIFRRIIRKNWSNLTTRRSVFRKKEKTIKCKINTDMTLRIYNSKNIVHGSSPLECNSSVLFSYYQRHKHFIKLK